MDTDSTQYEKTLTDTVWTETFKVDSWNVAAGFQVEWTLKDDFVAEEGKEYKILSKYSYAVNSLKGEGIISTHASDLGGMFTVPAESIVAYFEDGIACSHADHIDADGHITDIEITWNEDEEQAPSQGEEETPETPGQE